MEPIRRSRPLRQLQPTGIVIRMYVRIDDLRNLHLLGVGESDVRVDVLGTRIDNAALTDRAAAKQVRSAPQVVVVEGSEIHNFLARMETLFTPHFAVAFRALLEMKRYSALSSTRSIRKPDISIALR
jgi:hypothetical protein